MDYQLHPPRFSGDVAKIWKLILGTLGMAGYTHDSMNLVENFDVSLHAQRYGIGDEKSLTILVFILDYFQKKLMRKFFQKIQKKTFLDNCGPFLPNFGEKWIFLEKKTHFQIFQLYLPLCKKSEKINDPFLRKLPNRRTDRQRWFYRTLCGTSVW